MFSVSSGIYSYAVPIKKAKLSLSKTHPKLAKEADGWDPREFTFGSNRKKKWKCINGHTWETAISNRTRGKTGCPTCAGKKVTKDFNDLASRFPKIALEASGWDPKTVTSRSGKKLLWKCNTGHTWIESVHNRTRPNKLHYGCPVCSGHKILPGFNDLQTKFPEIAQQAFGWDPQTVLPGTEKVKSWKCEKGHVWKAMVYERTGKDKGFGCRICSGRELLFGYNDLKSRFPEIASEAFGWDPTKILAGHGKKKKWKCREGHVWSAEVSVRTSGGTGCPSCGKYGFSSADQAWMYLIEQPDWEMLQIGITNYLDQRLSGHKKLGWEILETRGPMDGQLAREWETSILKMLRAKKVELGSDKIAGKFDGYSEAWSKSKLPIESIKELMRLTEDFEEVN